MKNYILIIALLLSGLSFGQKLKVIDVNEDYFHHDKVEGFHCLYDRMPDYGYTWIGTLKIELDTIVQHTIKLNGEKMLLTELSYYQFEPKIGDVICLEIGSSAKKDKIEYKVDGKGWPRYFSFQMFHGLFSVHEISEYEWAYGEFLIQVLEKKPTGDRSLSNY